MAQHEFDKDMDRYGGSFDRAYNRNFDRSQYNAKTSLDQGRISMGRDDFGYESDRRDYERDFGESSRDYGWEEKFNQRERAGGWNDMDMRQNDFGTRRYSQDNFRETRWGGKEDHFGKGPKGWKRSDERIREEACEALYHNPRVDASDIEVDVHDRIITLSGNVDSRDTKRFVERCVEDITGVEDVYNHLRITDSPSPQNDERYNLSR